MSEQLPAPAASNTFERIKRVNSACADHFVGINEMVSIGSGAQRPIAQ